MINVNVCEFVCVANAVYLIATTTKIIWLQFKMKLAYKVEIFPQDLREIKIRAG